MRRVPSLSLVYIAVSGTRSKILALKPMGTKGTRYLGIAGGGTRCRADLTRLDLAELDLAELDLPKLDLPRRETDHEQAPKFRV